MDKRTIIVFLILIIYPSIVLAFSDANLTIQTASICLTQINDDATYCENDTMLIDGTTDNIIYIQPHSNIPKNMTVADSILYGVSVPINFIMSILAFLLLIIISLGVIYAIFVR